MTTNKAAEALLAELMENPLPGARYAYTVVKRVLPAIITEATAQQAAEVARLGSLAQGWWQANAVLLDEVARLREALETALLHLDHEHPGWAAQTIRAALAQPAVAPAPDSAPNPPAPEPAP